MISHISVPAFQLGYAVAADGLGRVYSRFDESWYVFLVPATERATLAFLKAWRVLDAGLGYPCFRKLSRLNPDIRAVDGLGPHISLHQLVREVIGVDFCINPVSMLIENVKVFHILPKLRAAEAALLLSVPAVLGYGVSTHVRPYRTNLQTVRCKLEQLSHGLQKLGHDLLRQAAHLQ